MPARFAVEAIGLNRWFVNACRGRGYDLVVVDAARLNLRSCGKKTDRRDALEIARRLRLGDLDRHAATYYPSDAEYGIRQLERIRHDLVDQRTHLSNRIRALLDAYKIAPPSGSLYKSPALQSLRQLRMAVPDLDLCLEALGARARAGRGVDSAAHASHRGARPRAEGRRPQGDDPAGRRADRGDAGRGAGDVRRFRNARAAASYSGLVPRVANSADVSHHGRITKRGNRELRWILNQVAVRLLATNPVVRRWAAPHLRRMHKNKVRTTLARRLLVGIYKVLLTGELFDMKRCLGLA